MKMNYRIWKIAFMALSMSAAGICYSCKREALQAEEVFVPKQERTDDREPHNAQAQEQETSAPVLSQVQNEQAAMEEKAVCFVHICGEVARPGVYEMEQGSRIVQAVEKAGGFTDRAAQGYLNLAQEVSDGMKLIIPSLEEVKDLEEIYTGSYRPDGSFLDADPSGAGSGLGNYRNGPALHQTAAAGVQVQKINLNTASKEELMTLKGIGESRAEDIIRYRESFGGFNAIEDIMNVSGIKDAAFQKIKDNITV